MGVESNIDSPSAETVITNRGSRLNSDNETPEVKHISHPQQSENSIYMEHNIRFEDSSSLCDISMYFLSSC